MTYNLKTKNFFIKTLFQTFFIFLTFLLIISCTKETKKIKDELTVNLGYELQSIDPAINDETYGFIYINHAFEGLLTKDINGKIVGGSSDKWEISEDKLKYTFHIREDAKWNDGKKLTADDFVYSYRRVVDPKTASPIAYLMYYIKNAKDINIGKKPIDTLGVTAIDENTLTIELENPTLYFEDILASGGCYVPVREDIINKYGDDWTWNPESYIGNGAYKMTERKPDELIAFELNTNYWDYKNQVAKKINFVLIADEYISLNAVRTGDVDFSINAPPIGEIESLIKENLMAVSDIIGVYYLDLNNKDKTLSDKRVRKALSLAIDRNYIVSNIGYGKLIAAESFVAPVVKGVEKSFREESSNFIIANNYSNNIIEAKKLLAEAGYPNGENFPILEVKVSSGFYTTVLEAIQEMWKNNLNIDVVVRTEESKITLPFRQSGKYQIARTSWTGDYNDPLTMLQIMTSESDINYSGFSNERYDYLINFATTSTNEKDRMEALKEAEAILFEEMPIIPFIYRTDFLVVNPKLKNYIDDPLGRYRFNYAYIEE
ncbi:peptide ABC transporter substrate-binding protein [Brachyspira pilosicoli]|uniref:Peptide ABC transporter substrate-binding protein n=1 Tax=Brachyspira pilosicoli TaxID=52584 RepID=A0AAJ6GH36_BRAPL|nr:peptide ABC transporter substrate-binding protein [Brachyspira pilosicoli]WIH90349.1 peptide ABC transporter substrate-binding protein [Brachyspira pilosicoli]WIH92640.1 peptide ABC transporter substrate-binding protein [Brachyspira pilosicoli]WIH94930.1 peptide ABC transporter substrate-binding protein [Brachyspira pilosicoli]